MKRLRKEVYKKNISDDDIKRAAAILHAQHIKFLTFNMVGAPLKPLSTWQKPYASIRKLKQIIPGAQSCSRIRVPRYSITALKKALLRAPQKSIHLPILKTAS